MCVWDRKHTGEPSVTRGPVLHQRQHGIQTVRLCHLTELNSQEVADRPLLRNEYRIRHWQLPLVRIKSIAKRLNTDQLTLHSHPPKQLQSVADGNNADAKDTSARVNRRIT